MATGSVQAAASPPGAAGRQREGEAVTPPMTRKSPARGPGWRHLASTSHPAAAMLRASVCAALLGLAALLAPAAAFGQLVSPTVTVGIDRFEHPDGFEEDRGYLNHSANVLLTSGATSFGSIANATFDHSGVRYTILWLGSYESVAPLFGDTFLLYFGLDRSLPDELSSYVLSHGDHKFTISDATKLGNVYGWTITTDSNPFADAESGGTVDFAFGPDTSTVSISGGGAVTEGGDATFTVTADPAPATPLTVNLAVTQTGDFVASGNLGAKTVTVPTSGTATYTVATVGDTVGEAHGAVTATVGTGTGYHVHATDSSASVTVNDDEPVVSISGLFTVTEGGAATFTVTASPAPATPLTVTLTVTQTGDFVASGDLGAKTVTVPTSGTAIYTVATVDDTVGEANGAVTATVGTGTGYHVHATDASASVTVNDDEPVVSISGGGAVTEGGDATFTVTASPAPASALTVNLAVTQTGDFVASGNLGAKTVTVPASGTATYTVATVGDTVGEANGAVTATVGTGTGYHVHATDSSAGVTVNDDDLPVVSISGGGAVTEGGDATFTVTADPAPASALTVSLTVTQTGSFVAPGDLGAKTVTVPASGTATYTVATVDDGWDDANGAVTATVGTGTGYHVQATDSSASVPVNDNDVPVVSISGGDAVTEGGDATFTVTATPAPASPLTVTLTVTQTGDFVASGDLGAKTVTIPTWGRATYTVATVDDNVIEASGAVTATVGTGTGYHVHATASLTGVAMNDNDQPVVRVSAGDAVTEGDDATFTVTVSPAPASALTVNLTVTQTGDVVASGNLGAKTVTVPTSGTATYTVATVDDTVGEAHGAVTVAVGTGTGYGVHATDASAGVAVNDNDRPVVRISGGGVITEGGDATFTVTATPAPASALTVNLTVAQTGDFVASGNLGAKTVTVPSSGTATFTVATVDDSLIEASGAVTATVGTGAGYHVHATASLTGVAVNDNDQPVVGVSAGDAVTEGDDATFTVTVSPAPATPLTVNLTVRQAGSVVAPGNLGAKTVTVPTSGTATYTVATVDDDAGEVGGAVIATVGTGTGYGVHATDASAYVLVHDNEPVVSVSAGSAVTEGGNATFTVTADPAPASPLTVSLGVWQSGSFVAAADLGAKTVTVPTSGTATYTVATVDDIVGEADGAVSVAVDRGTGYRVHGTDVAASVPVSDDDQPVVSISGGDAVTEGGTATFTVTVSPAPASLLLVHLTVTQTGSFVATVDDDAGEADGWVTATVGTGTGYGVHGTDASAGVAVRDNEPVVSISGGDAIAEGGDATFTVTADPAPATALTVSLTVIQTGDFVAAADLGAQTVTVPTSGTATYTVATVDDDAGEADGWVTATVGTGTGYGVHGTDASAGVAVRDNEPVVSISGGDAIAEGGDATFTVTASPAPPTPLTVNLTVTQTGSFVAPGDLGAKTVTVPITGTATYTVATVDDDAGEADGWVTATVGTGTGYGVHGTDASAGVAVRDNEPVVSISGGDAIAEGGDATFTVTADPAPATALTVSLTVIQTGDFVAAADLGAQTVTVPTSGTATYTVATVDDDAGEADGWVTATVGTGTGYGVHGTDASAGVAVRDNEPVVSISGGDAIAEGGDATFTVTASPAPPTPLTVNLTVAQTGSFVASGNLGAKTVTVPTSGTATYTVATVDDDAGEADGWVTATVGTGTGYGVHGTDASAGVAVRDNEPVVSISGGDAIAEGGDATFTVTADPAPATALTVSLTVIQTGDFVAAADLGAQTVTVPTSGTATYTVATVDDDAGEADGWVTATVGTGTGYGVHGTDASAGVAVRDNEPVVSISGGDAIAEGGDATFTVTASPAPPTPLTVSLTVTQTGSFVASGNLGAQTVTVPTSGTATYTVATVDDNADEASGAVTVAVDRGTGYRVHATDVAASVAVSDDDQPVVSISGGGAVTEGGDATFTVTVSPAPASALTVNLTVTQTGSFAASGDLGAKTVTVPTSGTATYTVATRNDRVNEPNGSVTLKVGAGTGYGAHDTDASATVTVNDNDTPTVRMAAQSGAVTEGGEAWFWLRVFPEPASALTVNLTVSQTGSFVASGDLGARAVTFPANSGEVYFTVPTVDDGAVEANGAVTLAVAAGAGYHVHAADVSGSVTVRDNDVPVVSISGGIAVTEGGNATFTVTADPAPASPLTVNLTVSQTGSFVAPGDLGEKTVTVPTSGTATYTVATVDDDAGEADGAVTAGVGTGTGYRVHGTDASASVTVRDDAATGEPTISGTARVGETLTAATDGIRDANGLDRVSYAYQWVREDDDGSNPADISGATASTYELAAADAGKKVRVRVSFTDDDGNAEALTSAAYPAGTDTVGAANNAATGEPTISGTARVGETLTAATDGIRDADGLDRVSYAYQWVREDEDGSNPADISGATASTYELAAADAGKKVRVRLTFTDDGGHDEARTSAPTNTVAAMADVTPTNVLVSNLGQTSQGTTPLALMDAAQPFSTGDNAGGYRLTGVDLELLKSGSGTPTVNFTASIWSSTATGQPASNLGALTSPGTFSETGVYEFTSTGIDLGANSDYFVLLDSSSATNNMNPRTTRADTEDSAVAAGWEIGNAALFRTRTSTGAFAAGSVAVKIRIRGDVVTAANNAATGTPTISGTARVGETLTAATAGIGDADGLDSVSYAYQWVRVDADGESNPADISGATASTYELAAADQGKKVRVRVSFTDDAGHDEALTGAAYPAGTDTVGAANNAATGEPTISGTARVGETLTAATAGIGDADGLDRVSYAYQWVRVDADGESNPADISGATASTYELAAADQGKKVRVRVSFTDDDGHDEALTSAAYPAGTDAVGAANNPVTTPFQVRLDGVPEEHDGSTPAVFEVEFNKRPDAGYSYRTMRDETLVMRQGGAALDATRVRRLNKPHNDRWEVTVTPVSRADITVSIGPFSSCTETGAVCAANDEVLANEVDKTIQGPPGLSVADARVDENTGDPVAFAVTLGRASRHTVTVDYATSDGAGASAAVAGQDYEARSGTLTFAAGETTQTVSVPVVQDSHDEGEETFTLTLSNPAGGNAWLADALATGMIVNTDAMPQAWLARFGRTVAEQVIGAVEGRFAAQRTPGVEVRVAGHAIGGATFEDAGRLGDRASAQPGRVPVSDWPEDGARPGSTPGPEAVGPGGHDARTVTARDLLTGTSFALTVGAPAGGMVAVWGHGAASRFDGRAGELTLDGEVTSVMLGADWATGPASGPGAGGWTAGVLVSRAEGEGTYRDAGAGDLAATLTGLWPYGRYQVSERLTLWGVAGVGEGALELTPEGQAPLSADLDLVMAATGLRGEVLAAPAAGGVEVAVTSDALAVRTSSEKVAGLAAAAADVTRLRLGLEGTWRGLAAGGGTLSPRVEAGVRHDGGDAETGFGLDLGGGLAWSHPASGLSAELSGRGLLTHEAPGFRDRGLSGSLAWDPGQGSGRGPRLTLTRTIGSSAAGGVDALLRRETLAGLAPGDPGAGRDDLANRRLELRFGYGFPAFGHRFTATPEAGVGLSNGHREFSLGWRLGLARSGPVSMNLGLEATRHEPAAAGTEPVHALVLRGSVRW